MATHVGSSYEAQALRKPTPYAVWVNCYQLSNRSEQRIVVHASRGEQSVRPELKRGLPVLCDNAVCRSSAPVVLVQNGGVSSLPGAA
eukprot:6182406-Pleurochrysis_carterae.AAC.5